MQLKNDTMLATESEQARKKEREFIEPMQQTFRQFSCSVVVTGRFFDMALLSLSIYCTHLFFLTFQDCCQNIQHVFFFSWLLVDFLYTYKIPNTSRDFIFLFFHGCRLTFILLVLPIGLLAWKLCVGVLSKIYMQTTKLKKRHISCCPIWVCLLSRIQFSST